MNLILYIMCAYDTFLEQYIEYESEMTVVTINRLTCSGIFSVKLTFENTEMSEMNPREETSTV